METLEIGIIRFLLMIWIILMFGGLIYEVRLPDAKTIMVASTILSILLLLIVLWLTF